VIDSWVGLTGVSLMSLMSSVSSVRSVIRDAAYTSVISAAIIRGISEIDEAFFASHDVRRTPSLRECASG